VLLLSRLVYDLTIQNASNAAIVNIDLTDYDKKSIFQFEEIPMDTQIKREDLTKDFPLKIVENTLSIEKNMLETGVFYSLRYHNEELLIRKTVEGKVQIFEVLE
jgi:hypothetical protein